MARRSLRFQKGDVERVNMGAATPRPPFNNRHAKVGGGGGVSEATDPHTIHPQRKAIVGMHYDTD